ncbi:kelch repeat and BTB domain-containing protein 8-like [Branchiostoma lanceolatum]|uniref:kelch repeat and BTB domain-containing protein 8-like n=1 Tax=Branchiostoma lanceolatum TaxID=7740 RepID=UPI003452A6C3
MAANTTRRHRSRYRLSTIQLHYLGNQSTGKCNVINMAAADQEPHASAVRPRSYHDKGHLHGFLGAVDDLQKAGVLQDVILEVEGRRFPCHRLVLSAASPYFRAMFTSDMAESRQKTVVLQGLDAGMFGEILSYIYSGTLHVSLDKVQLLYQAADLLQLDYVRDTCSSYMATNVECSTCVDLYKFADVFSLNIVRKRGLQWIDRNFAEVSSGKEFCSLSVNQLTEIISHDELVVKEETTVWEAVVRWVQHSREDRLHHLPSILPHIRFNLLTPYKVLVISDHPLVKEDPGRSAIRNVVKTSNLKRRVGMDTMEMALICARRNRFDPREGNEVLWMNPGEGKYIRCDYNISPFEGTVTSDNDIYVLVAESRKKISLFKYNHVGNEWEKKSTVRKEPENVQTTDLTSDYLMVINGHLFCLTGTYSVVVLKKYNQHTNKWHTCSTPGHDGRLAGFAALSCNQHIYLLTETELHCYDPKEDHWCKKTPPDNSPDIYSAVALGTEIFCCFYTGDDLNKTIVYDTEADQWHELSGRLNTVFDISNVVLFVLENKLHAVVEGEIDTDEFTDVWRTQVCVYDRCEGVWREISVLPDRRWNLNPLMLPVARMHLYLNTSHADTQVAANPEGAHAV